MKKKAAANVLESIPSGEVHGAQGDPATGRGDAFMKHTLPDSLDERGDLPSMSSIERIMLCPGSEQLIARLRPALPERPEDEWTQSGSRVHDALAADDGDESAMDGLDESEADFAERAKAEVARLLEQFGFGQTAQVIIKDRTRLWLHDDTLNAVASGQPDLVIIENGRFLLVDYKSGWGGATETRSNPQLLGYAVLVAEPYPVTGGHIAVIARARKLQVAEVTRDDLANWRAAILSAIALSKTPGAPRFAGHAQCAYCPARPLCPEAWAKVIETLSFTPETLLDGRDRDRFLLAKHASKTIAAYLALLKAKITENPDAVPGLRKKADAPTFSISDGAAAWQQLQAFMPLEQFLSACKPSLNGLASVLTGGKPSVKKLTKDGEIKRNEIIGLLGDVIERGTREGSIEAV